MRLLPQHGGALAAMKRMETMEVLRPTGSRHGNR